MVLHGQRPVPRHLRAEQWNLRQHVPRVGLPSLLFCFVFLPAPVLTRESRFAYDDPVGCICDAPESQRDCRNCTATVFCQFNTCCGGYCSPADKDAYCGSTQCSSPIKLSPDCPANAPATKRLRATPNSGPAPAQHVRK